VGNPIKEGSMRKLALATGTALAVSAVLLTVVATAGGGERGHARAVLNGYQEVVGGGGSFSAKVDTKAKTISYELSYTLEGGTALFAHIHFAERHVSGGISAFLCNGPTTPACPTPGGTVKGVITPADVVGPTGQGIEPGSFDELVRAIEAGATYANVHSTRWPGGEIRGQIADHESDDDD
jgi:CHRD domain-containing protein